MPITEKEFVGFCQEMEFEFLPIKLAHVMNLRNLKLRSENISHKDPFDRMLIAQSEYENLDFTQEIIFYKTILMRTYISFKKL